MGAETKSMHLMQIPLGRSTTSGADSIFFHRANTIAFLPAAVSAVYATRWMAARNSLSMCK